MAASEAQVASQGGPEPWFGVLAGRSGTGKTTLAKGLAWALGACYLRVDAIEAALFREGSRPGAQGYAVAHELAASNLMLGTSVVVDAVNPVPEARVGWPQAASRAGARLAVLEAVLPDPGEHRRRVDSRTADIPGARRAWLARRAR